MAELIKKIRTDIGDLQIDYTALANLPISDTTLSEAGRFADAKVVGDQIEQITSQTGINFVEMNSKINNINSKIDSAVCRIEAVLTEGTGEAYTASIDDIESLKVGTALIMIPHTTSTTNKPTLNVNNFGAKLICRCRSDSTYQTYYGQTDEWLVSNYPVLLIYNGDSWVANLPKTVSSDIDGPVLMTQGGTGAISGRSGLANLFEDGPTKISSHQYGDTLPAAGSRGRIFFKKVSD